jgi:heptosyltransferase-3
MRAMSWITPGSSESERDFHPQEIKRILVVRSLFRMGDVILATPAILLFRKNFPSAQIDFVGSELSRRLFANLPVDRHYEVHRRFPEACWSYVMLLKQIRERKYDLAFEASGSSAALGAFIIGFSGARLRVGLKGKWDRWFNVRLHRPATRNKYRILPDLFGSLGLDNPPVYPTLYLSPGELRKGKTRIQAFVGSDKKPIIGVFVGGRKRRGKRWAKENFLELGNRLLGAAAQPMFFVGPEEKDLFSYFQREFRHQAPTIFEPDPRSFATLVASCDLFVACDSGPVHLACALRVRAVAIFLKDEFNHWGPPPELARIVRPEQAVSVKAVFDACRRELLRCPSAEAEGPQLNESANSSRVVQDY